MTQHRAFLRALHQVARCKNKRNRLIRKATKEQLNMLRNLCHNVCRKKFRLPEKVRQRILPYRHDIRDLACKKNLKPHRV